VVRQLPKWDDPNLLVGAEHFSDAGVYQVAPGLAMVQSVDFFPPLVDDPFAFGQIAAANSMSDIFATGADPKTALNIVCFPDDELDLAILSEILAGGAERVRAAGAVIVGGHSVRDKEIKYGLAVTGLVDPARMFTNAGARPGDVLVLTKPLGTGFVTTAFKKGACPSELLQVATKSMVELNQAASRAAREARADAVTDITGFGLAGHALEMAEASEVTVVIRVDTVPLLPGVEELVRQGYRNRAVKTNRAWAERSLRIADHVDPVRLELVFDPQTSGGLLVALREEWVDTFVRSALQQGCRVAATVGFVERRNEVALRLE
jgi:selenide,water dikinase